jgi:hypothetical protein
MIHRLASNIDSARHCRPSKGLGKSIVLFGFEGRYRFWGSKSATEGIVEALAAWLNPDRLIKSGRCKSILVPHIRKQVSTT